MKNGIMDYRKYSKDLLNEVKEQAKADLCDNYCKYPAQFEDDDEEELYKICGDCPLNWLN